MNSISQTSSIAARGCRERTLLGGFVLTFALTAGTLALASYLWGRGGSDLIIVGMGWPHVLLGFMFYATRVIKNDPLQRASFLWLMMLTLVICSVHGLWSILPFVQAYFSFHAFRDEILLYHQRRSGFGYTGPAFDHGGRILLIVAILVTTLQSSQPLLMSWMDWSLLQKYPYILSLGWAALAMICGLAAFFSFPRAFFESRLGLRYAAPALALVLIALAGMKVGRFHSLPIPLFFAFLVVFHYFSWYVYSVQKLLARRPAPVKLQATASMTWHVRIMATPRGFLTAIAALSAVSFAGAYTLQAGSGLPWLRYGFSLDYFYYVLIFHVTMSFAPKSIRRPAAPAPAMA